MSQSTYLHSPLVKAIYKREGITPLEAIDEFRLINRSLEKDKISYAGRLDPMADGVLLLLIGDANKHRNDFLSFEKTYRINVLFGISTDSFDILGMPQVAKSKNISITDIKKVLDGFKGTFLQKFPPYSSKPVNGRPLFYWAKNGRLDEIEIPEKERSISSIAIVDTSNINGGELINKVLERIKDVQGDFRQQEIADAWASLKARIQNDSFQLATIEVSGSSGLYMRQLAVDIGQKLSQYALAYSITRTHVGPFTIERKTA